MDPSSSPPAIDYPVLASSALHERCSLSRHFELAHTTRFHSSRVPHISTLDYVKRIAKYSRCSTECFIIAIMYLDKYVENTQIPITFRNVHRLLITATLVAVKVRDDLYYNNAYYASIGGITPQEINTLEIDFLAAIDWNTWVEPQKFDACVEMLSQRFDTDLSKVSATHFMP